MEERAGFTLIELLITVTGISIGSARESRARI